MSWWKFLSRKRDSGRQLDTELSFHIEKLTEENMAAGMAPTEARRQAILEFGGQEQLKEELRDVYRIATLENTVANLKSAIRFIRKSPTFSVAVILTLALGIGGNSAVFSAIDAILLRPLPFPNGDELMVLHQVERKVKGPWSFTAPVRLEDWNRLNKTFQAISGYYTSDASETSGPLPEKVTVALVAPRFFEVWGISPALGRDFTRAEEHFGGPKAVLISDRLWRRRFHGDPNVIGKPLHLDQGSTTIVGVMPASFLFPDHDADVWAPSPPDSPVAQSRESTWFKVIGRLKPHVAVSQARADLENVQAQLGRQFPKTDADLSVEILPLKETTVGGVRRSLWVLFGSVSLLLLIACTNIAALLLARTAEREREISIRYSLGASRASLIAQLLSEAFVLALAGAALGLFVAHAAAEVFRLLAKSFPRVEEITLDWRIVLYTLVCAVGATLLCGLFPAIRGTRRGIAGELAHASRTQVSGRNPLQWLLVGVQVSLAVTLLVGAGLLLRSFQALSRVSPGFDASHVLTLRITGNWGETADMKKLRQRMNRTLDELRATPGVRAAATSVSLPGISADSQTEVKLLEGHAATEGKIIADSRFVSNGYFATMQIPLLAGQGCREAVTGTDTVVVNRSFASKYFAESPAIGHHLQWSTSQFVPQPAEIRGIAADAREQGLNHEPSPTIYWCESAPDPSPYVLIRTQGEPLAMAATLRRRIHQLDPARSVYDIAPLEEHLYDDFGETRLRTFLLTLFALTAVSLASIGLYGTLSYFVTIRRREVGLRLALGALRGQIVKHFLFAGLRVSLLGCAAGLLAAAGCARALAGMLYGVTTSDATTFAGVALLVLVVAALASSIPATRAALVEPMRVLRDE
ncbi:MAG TPA: ABC transporter permease [Bryobacteraceae bacterium]